MGIRVFVKIGWDFEKKSNILYMFVKKFLATTFVVNPFKKSGDTVEYVPWKLFDKRRLYFKFTSGEKTMKKRYRYP